MTKHKEDLINEVLDYFDFEKVHKVLELFDFPISDSYQTYNTIGDLRRFVRRLCNTAYDKNYSGYEFGGFIVSYNGEDNYMKLSFEVTSWEVYGDDEECPF